MLFKVKTNRPNVKEHSLHKHLELLVCYIFSTYEIFSVSIKNKTCALIISAFRHKDLRQIKGYGRYTQNI